MNKLKAPHEQIEVAVELSGLAYLVCASYDIVDKELLFVFVERWHVDTILVHLPIEVVLELMV